MKKIFIILFIISFQLKAQDWKETAQEKFNNQEWKDAATAYKKYLKKNDSDSSAWYNMAYSHAQLQEYDEALSYFEEAAKRNFNASFVSFSISKIHAKREEKDLMITKLNEGAKNGLAAYTNLITDEAFTSYQDLPEFIEVLKKVELNAYPCLSSEDARHFDFWLGEWEVYVNNQKVGDNSITMAKGGCAIHENYITARNYAGQSINFYDLIDKKWHQHWVGSAGDIYNYVETKRDEGMLQFESKFMNPNGKISISRLTFTLNKDGTVRQLFESSSDEGKTWASAFDGLYKKKTAK